MNTMDKKSVESVASGLRPASNAGDAFKGKDISDMGTGLVSLRMDDCQLRPAALEILGGFIAIVPACIAQCH